LKKLCDIVSDNLYMR